MDCEVFNVMEFLLEVNESLYNVTQQIICDLECDLELLHHILYASFETGK